MKKQRLLLAALIISISTWVSASVPVINVADAPRVDVSLYSPRALNNIFFKIKDNSKLFGASTGIHDQYSRPVSHQASGTLSGMLGQAGDRAILSSRQVSAGSFSSHARQTYPLQTAPFGFSGTELRYGAIVTSSSVPKSWAIILLALGCVVYQGRRRQRPFGL
ncbi:MAG: hypothetical protein ABI575_11010 [Oxalobacteraceae bacterium]